MEGIRSAVCYWLNMTYQIDLSHSEKYDETATLLFSTYTRLSRRTAQRVLVYMHKQYLAITVDVRVPKKG